MKKLFAPALAVLFIFALTACDPKAAIQNAVSDALGGGSGSAGAGVIEDKIDVGGAAGTLLEDAIGQNAFSVAAALVAMKERGVEKADVEPDWDYTVDEESYHAYGDSGAYGHGVIRFTKKDGEVSDEEYEAWTRKLFDATARISDDGYNIHGFDNIFSSAEPNSEIGYEEAVGKDAFMPGWGYKYKGTYMVVSVERTEAPGFDSEYVQDDDGNWYFTHCYTAVQADVRTGLQKSFDDAWEDMENAFEENEDAIRDALDDYGN